MTQDEADAIARKMIWYVGRHYGALRPVYIKGIEDIANSFVDTCDCCAPDCKRCNPELKSNLENLIELAKTQKEYQTKILRETKTVQDYKNTLDAVKKQSDLLAELKRKFGN